MPVVTVAAAPHPDGRALLRAVADAVADALHLGAGDVIALAAPVAGAVASGDAADAPDRRWMLITIHGSDRGAEPTRRARVAAAEAAAEWNRRHRVDGDVGADAGGEGVWCEWTHPRHP